MGDTIDFNNDYFDFFLSNFIEKLAFEKKLT